MTTDNERFALALRAHASEHVAMHERGLGACARVGVVGRPYGIGRPWQRRGSGGGGGAAAPLSYGTTRTASYSAPATSAYRYSRQTVRGLGEVASGSTIFWVLGLGVGAAALYIAYDELAGTGRKLRRR